MYSIRGRGRAHGEHSLPIPTARLRRAVCTDKTVSCSQIVRNYFLSEAPDDFGSAMVTFCILALAISSKPVSGLFSVKPTIQELSRGGWLESKCEAANILLVPERWPQYAVPIIREKR